MAVHEEGTLLVVSLGARLAPVCVKCGARDGIAVRSETMTWVRPWMWALLATGALGVVIISLAQRPAVVNLPLCTACDARWRRVARTRTLVTFAVLPITIVAPFVLIALPWAVAGPITLALFVAWAGAYAAVHLSPQMKDATVWPARIDRGSTHLRGVHPDARRALAAAASSDGAFR